MGDNEGQGYVMKIKGAYYLQYFVIMSKPQLNHNSTQPNITLSWVRHENDFAYHTIPPPPTETQC